MYAVTAQIEQKTDNWTRTVSLPTFYLDENVQGFTDEAGATRVARDVVTKGCRTWHKDDTLHLTVVRL